MNAKQLLAHYERIAEAPDAIARLRRFVLDLAVRGKLVEQNPADEPAPELLKRIAAETARLVKAGTIKAARAGKLPTTPRPVFALPHGWAWVDLREVCTSITDGDHLPPPKSESGVPFLVIGDVRTKTINYGSERRVSRDYYDALDPIRQPRPGDLLYTLVGSFGIPVEVIEDREFCVQRHIGILRPSAEIHGSYLARVMESEFVFLQAEACATGIAQKTVPLAGLRAIRIPLPPIAEQHRTVAKVDELMELCDRLEKARKEREAARDRLTAASLARLNAPDPDPATFTTHARLALENLPALTTRADQIKHLRQTILNLAVRGKLVKQDPSEVPAKAFGKSRLAAEAEQASQEREVPFECPTGWCWTTVQQTLAKHREISYGVIKLGDEPKAGGISTLRCSDVRPGLIELSGVRKVREEIEADYARTRLRGGEIVINIRGTLGGVALVPDTLAGFNVAREVAVIPIAPEISGSFMVYTMLSPFFWDYIQSNLRGIAYKGLNLGILRKLPIPFPPLAEQSRIVTKVDELMDLCDRMETCLTTGDETRQRLLDAILHEALEPAKVRELELA